MISDELLFEVATDYYVKGMLQKDIANKYGVSRVQISKYLKMAQERGIVHIEVEQPSVKTSVRKEYEDFFREKYDLKKMFIARGARNEKTVLKALSREVHKYLKTLPEKPMNIGLGWGNTVFTVAESIEKLERPDWQLIPLSGGTARLADKRFNINHIVQNFATRLSGKAVPMYLPFIFENAHQLENTKQSLEYMNIQKLWNSLDIIICSVGYSIARSPLFRENLLEVSYADELEKNDVVGDVLTHYFDINGKRFEKNILNKCINLSFEQYMNAGERVIVAAGHHKVDGLVGMLRGGFADVLITDEFTAKFVKEYIVYDEGGQ
ncbi:MAG: sugar-binding domain-containing protein [Mesotoga sp.]|uniref:sugar-binding transcriptional regulator n=1 Tax=unclassified Mesotoga TaxID=1184398 RepID=UPI000EF1EAC8|nr:MULTISPECIES: sugar-binding domain-containing protein [unclassified Mesotoga]MDI9368952.1 sugar-binding domain-containing protein [Thermotogota bacterium]MDD2333510.1 sugar-binding domain-containing protein [Mesotoga sp.]MDD3681422.1 sugar-binding domain-containing protein [Mesotoga sp.]MDD4207839.1 sugar-binding domain-containing protein [Mesotoga sp.]MDD5683848.1 sugar-binding domain-containing protein [Mesotoga sp.]